MFRENWGEDFELTILKNWGGFGYFTEGGDEREEKCVYIRLGVLVFWVFGIFIFYFIEKGIEGLELEIEEFF